MLTSKEAFKKKIHIFFKFTDQPWGGGNQFLKALRNEFKKNNVYSNNSKNADFILFNSHHNLKNIVKLKFKHPKKIFVHRIDGPISLIRDKNLIIDKLVFRLSNKIADLSIFQSKWSLKQSTKLGFQKTTNTAIIYNAPDKTIFNKKNKQPFKASGKIRLIATSWSSNPNKGFKIYKYLDKNLDFNKYEFIFIGNSPIKFKNILHIQPLPSKKLATELKKSDIYITASKNDPCSNSLIEALSCGLPAVVLDNGGHPELIQKGGETFSTAKEAIKKINKIANNYQHYQNKLPEYDIQQISKNYIDSFSGITHSDKKIGFFSFVIIFLQIKITRLISLFK